VAGRARRRARHAAGDPGPRPAPVGRALPRADRLAGRAPPRGRRDRPARLSPRAAGTRPAPRPARRAGPPPARGRVRRARRRGDPQCGRGRMARVEARGGRARRLRGARIRLHPGAAAGRGRALPVVGGRVVAARRGGSPVAMPGSRLGPGRGRRGRDGRNGDARRGRVSPGFGRGRHAADRPLPRRPAARRAQRAGVGADAGERHRAASRRHLRRAGAEPRARPRGR